jgi:DeoR family transcriptional regulator, aga operon transcriptional repressor
MEALLNKAMIRTAQKTIILTDSSKFGRRGFGKICPLSDIDQIITDDGISPAVIRDLENMGIEVIIV